MLDILLKQPLNLENMILHIEFQNPLLCGIAKNVQGDILLCEISGLWQVWQDEHEWPYLMWPHSQVYYWDSQKQIRQMRNGSRETNVELL